MVRLTQHRLSGLKRKLKAQAVTQAEKEKDVAALDLDKAKLEAEARMTRAKAEADAKELLLEADGALEQKLEAWKFAQEKYAAALGKHRLVPDMVLGGDGKNGNNADAASTMLTLMGAKAARDLQLDMRVKK